jgi:signal peptidase I
MMIIVIMFKYIRNIGAFFLDIIETVVIALSIFLVVYLFLLQPHQVNGKSMVPTFQSGEFVLTDKVSYRLKSPVRGEVVIFHAPPEANCPEGTGCDFIKRILGVPGDTVEVKNDKLYINGQPLLESYLPSDFKTNAGAFTQNRAVNLGPDEYFVVGDNRSYSSDSRVWGPVTKSEIVGRAFFRYWPFEKIGIIKKAQYQ